MSWASNGLASPDSALEAAKRRGSTKHGVPLSTLSLASGVREAAIPENSAATPYRQPSALRHESTGTSPPVVRARPPRDWVKQQAAMDAERASFPAAQTSSGSPVCRPVNKEPSIFVQSRPAPSPPPPLPANVGIPWLTAAN